jgi:hypothetical protein
MLKKKMTELMNRTSEVIENRMEILYDPAAAHIIGGVGDSCGYLNNCGTYSGNDQSCPNLVDCGTYKLV